MSKTKSDDQNIYERMFADPELHEDEETESEVFAFMKHRGKKPEDLPDPKDREAYTAWLEKNP